MRPMDRYTKPQLQLIRPRGTLAGISSKARELTQEALKVIENVDEPDIVTRLRTVLKIIDAEIAKAAAEADHRVIGSSRRLQAWLHP